GVATGLSVSEYSGGTTLYIETEVIGKLKNDKTNYHATGSLGKVMSESISIAFSVAKTHLKNMLKENHLTNKNLSDDDLNKNNNIEKVKENFFEENYIHIHFPEGSIPKDGPSAGVAMVTALISLATKKTVKKDMAMTGEISLVGNVLPVGGIKEKVLGAKLSLMKEVILPKENMADWEEMDDVVKKDIKPYFVESVAEVLKIAF
ncbi:ATP-dependent Lon protease pim1, partial [Bonamia ostreae]